MRRLIQRLGRLWAQDRIRVSLDDLPPGAYPGPRLFVGDRLQIGDRLYRLGPFPPAATGQAEPGADEGSGPFLLVAEGDSARDALPWTARVEGRGLVLAPPDGGEIRLPEREILIYPAGRRR